MAIDRAPGGVEKRFLFTGNLQDQAAGTGLAGGDRDQGIGAGR